MDATFEPSPGAPGERDRRPLSVSTPVLLGSTSPTASGAASTATWFNFATVPNVVFAINWSVIDR